ncbi:uncharacterized protein LODBEIA_P60160 [Lodderomyces beijingensis]|uniref:LSM complex subunit LSM4 n=1 Tax=Lodderomyces beijingensis TaxID=1775926 RepID=A0ABP0ZX06_9ASCO
MLPLYLLTAAKNKPVLIELKTGESYNGNLTNCDNWMNLTLHDVIQTSAQGDRFTKIPEIYIRGMHIKYLRIPDSIMDHIKEQQQQQQQQAQQQAGYDGRNRGFNYRRMGQGQGGSGRGGMGGGRDRDSGSRNERNERRGGGGGFGGRSRRGNQSNRDN